VISSSLAATSHHPHKSRDFRRQLDVPDEILRRLLAFLFVVGQPELPKISTAAFAVRLAIEAKRLTQPVLQKALVAEMHQFGVVYKEDKGWGIDLRLSGVQDIEPLPTGMRQIVGRHRRLHHVIHYGSGQSLQPLPVYLIGLPYNLPHSLSEPGGKGGVRTVFLMDPEGNLMHLIQRETPLP